MGIEPPFDLDPRDLTRGASAEQRLLAAVHRHFRRLGGAPSYRELSQATTIAIKDIGGVLARLEARGEIRRDRGRARGIVFVRRCAMLSDVELELEAAARGATLTWPAPAANPLVEAYPVDQQGTDFGLQFEDLLNQIDAAEEWRHGSGKAKQGQGVHPGAG